MEREIEDIAGLLTPNERTFCELYVLGKPGIRGNGTECYIQSYKTENRNTAATNASNLLKKPEIIQYKYELQVQASREAIDRFRSWHELAVDAQDAIVNIANGWFVSKYDVLGKQHTEPIMIQDRETAAAATVVLRAAMEIVDRAYPKKLAVSVTEDDLKLLEETLGRRLPSDRS